MDHQLDNVGARASRVGRGGPFLTSLRRDSTAPPERQVEQILAIYPIVDSQKLGQNTAIPPRKPPSQPAASPPTTTAPSGGKAAEGDLIDFGGSDDVAAPPPQEPATQCPDSVERALASTSKAPEGPLINFAHEMKAGLPSPQQHEAPP